MRSGTIEVLARLAISMSVTDQACTLLTTQHHAYKQHRMHDRRLGSQLFKQSAFRALQMECNPVHRKRNFSHPSQAVDWRIGPILQSVRPRDARFPTAVCAPLRRLRASRDVGRGAHAGVGHPGGRGCAPGGGTGPAQCAPDAYLFMDSFHKSCRPRSGRGRRRSWRPRTRASPKQRASPMCT